MTGLLINELKQQVSPLSLSLSLELSLLCISLSNLMFLSHSMSWFSGILVPKVDERKTAWGERNGPKRHRPALCGPRYMSCLQDPELERGGSGGLGLNCSWQEDHYGKKQQTPLQPGPGDLGLKAVDLGFEDGSGPMGEAKGLSASDCGQRLLQVFRSKRFRSAKLERLYQRYFFQMNQSSLTVLMGVLVLACGIMLLFHCVPGNTRIPYIVALAMAAALFFVLMILCNRTGFHQDCMWAVSYLVIGALCGVQALGTLLVSPRSASEGVWWSVFFIYIIYTLLPVRMRVAVLAGASLSVLHLVISWHQNRTDSFLWKQVRSWTEGKRHCRTCALVTERRIKSSWERKGGNLAPVGQRKCLIEEGLKGVKRKGW